ncbi:class I SAM-dependent methyltransferase [Candidatus Pelagibacter sp.]|nr:class I SAM-dependent methyltransferase [Candidatus Pelagibacter sp.]
MIGTFDLFQQSRKNSGKHKKYFEVYDKIFERFRNKKITFVEVGVLNGGSLEIWKKYFHEDSRIIGIDLNPECKKFEEKGVEIFIGDQSSEIFWDNFFKKVGKVDILLDDGGHTNLQQIITIIKSTKNINNDGIIVTEDTHSSYMSKFGNPSRYSFINFAKKLIDDINFKFPNLGKFKNSLNDYIYSIAFFESFVVFHINTQKTTVNEVVTNNSNEKNIKDFRYHGLTSKSFLRNKIFYVFNFLKKNKIIIYIHYEILKKIKFFKDKIKLKKYFK